VVSPPSSALVSPASSVPLPEEEPVPASSVLPPLLELLLEPPPDVPPLEELLLEEEPPPEEEEEEEDELDEPLLPLAPASWLPPVGATHCPPVHAPLQQSVAVEQSEPLEVHVAPMHAPDLQL
jgi:hypothetical protein